MPGRSYPGVTEQLVTDGDGDRTYPIDESAQGKLSQVHRILAQAKSLEKSAKSKDLAMLYEEASGLLHCLQTEVSSQLVKQSIENLIAVVRVLQFKQALNERIHPPVAGGDDSSEEKSLDSFECVSPPMDHVEETAATEHNSELYHVMAVNLMFAGMDASVSDTMVSESDDGPCEENTHLNRMVRSLEEEEEFRQRRMAQTLPLVYANRSCTDVEHASLEQTVKLLQHENAALKCMIRLHQEEIGSLRCRLESLREDERARYHLENQMLREQNSALSDQLDVLGNNFHSLSLQVLNELDGDSCRGQANTLTKGVVDPPSSGSCGEQTSIAYRLNE